MKKVLFLILFAATNVCAQDVIVKKDGSVIQSKVVEITSDVIKYKKFTNLDGPTYSVSVSEIMSINYENGETEKFESKVFESPMEKKTYVLKAGTRVPLSAPHAIYARDVNVGQIIKFKVNQDISADGHVVLPSGTIANGKVYIAKKSSWFGTKGKLGILIEEVVLPNGGIIPINNGDVYVTGSNRTTLSVLLFLLAWPCCFITGSKAVLPQGYELVTTVKQNVVFDEDGEIDIKPITFNTTSSSNQYPAISQSNSSYSYVHNEKVAKSKLKAHGDAIYVPLDNSTFPYPAKLIVNGVQKEIIVVSETNDVYIYHEKKGGNKIGNQKGIRKASLIIHQENL